jgi:hypothetical protein
MKRERMGEVTVPSGTLTILDPGHIGMFENGEIAEVPAVMIGDLPRDRPLPVWGVRVGAGRWEKLWDHVVIEVSDAAAASTVTSSEEVGTVMVDFARVLLCDESNPDSWVHSDCIDGKADFVFWGRDAADLATAVGAPALEDGNFGWRDMDVDEVVERGTAAEKLRTERGWKLATDFRPHSHHWALLELARASETESGTIDVGTLRVCLFFTTWGDGMFPVFVDKDAGGAPVQIRIQLHTADSAAAMAHVNG